MTSARASEPDYLTTNRANWDERAAIHVASPDYEAASFVSDPRFLSGVVRFDLPRLGDVRGAEAVHLQCHIGTDTISLARLGAHMTGLDLSGESVAHARRLAAAAGAEVDYVESDVYAASEALGGRRYDLVYVSLGALSWLPSVERWSSVVDTLLRPGGRLFIRDSHPMLDTLEPDPTSGVPVPTLPYFEHPEPVVWHEEKTYVAAAEGSANTLSHTETHTWSHALGETVTALLDRGLVLSRLVEHDSVPFCPFPGLMTRDDLGEYRMSDGARRIAMSFTIEARKPHP